MKKIFLFQPNAVVKLHVHMYMHIHIHIPHLLVHVHVNVLMFRYFSIFLFVFFFCEFLTNYSSSSGVALMYVANVFVICIAICINH